jgi:hypothetical protein
VSIVEVRGDPWNPMSIQYLHDMLYGFALNSRVRVWFLHQISIGLAAIFFIVRDGNDRGAGSLCLPGHNGPLLFV